jgi:hypothetical protein
MKRIVLGFFTVCLLITASFNPAFAQEDKSTTIHITITEDGSVTTDTTFELREGQDPDMIEKMIHHLSGDEIWHVETSDFGIDLDSLKEAHEGAKVLVIKDKNGNITVSELGGECNEDVRVVKRVRVEVKEDIDKEMEKELEVDVDVESKRKEDKN